MSPVKLCDTPYLLMLDNLESVTGQALAIQNTLPAGEQQKLRQFLLKLVGGKTKVVLGSRSDEAWLTDAYTHGGKANVYPLGGLDPESRTVLAEKILEAQVGDGQRIAALRQDDDFKRLMALLAGYPLAMEVVLANLARQSPQEILAALNAADVDLNVGGGDKTNNILKCVEYSHSNLSPQAQKLLVCLAPFDSFIFQGALENYGKQLQQREPFADYDFAQFDVAIQEAIHWGLLSPHESGFPGLLTIQPIFPYFLRTKLNHLEATTRDALYDGFKAHYQGLAGSYQQLMASKDPNQRQLGLLFCRLEYENLYTALQICLRKRETIDIFFCLAEYLKQINDIDGRLQLSKFVCDAHDSYPKEICKGEIRFEMTMALDRLAYCYLAKQSYQQAQLSYSRIVNLLEQMEEGDQDSKRHKNISLASTYHQLGYVAQEQRQYEQARSHYQQALDIKIEFNDRYSQASTYHQLGNVAEELREYEQARSHYQQALDIKIEFGDRYSQASTYHQLGIVAQALREYEQARSHYQQALDIKIEFNDRYSQASTYHQLGIVAQELREFEQARSHYQQALDIKIEFGESAGADGSASRYSQARTYGQLGLLAEAQEDYSQAQQHLQKALEIFVEFNDQHSAEMVLQILARLYQNTQDDLILTAIAQCLHITPAQVQQHFAAASA
ncbi:tetratricopeptide repeat protein [Leptolyngbya sp. PCC 6406]|uniref:tetratricopeptide repeat protein n=1 Tax=Leptolyngbya sp. PCC 6406 TaxID=1173264 RepID=UPI00192C1BEB|nr:tetratricopeptide repeat protein [Leptolyngbya sp. PCC 6406]